MRKITILIVLLFAATFASADQLIFNGGFDYGMAGWGTTGTAFGFYATTGPMPYSGHYMSPLSGNFAVSDENYASSQVMWQNVTIAPNRKVTVSFDLRIQNMDGGPICNGNLAYYYADECGYVDLLPGNASPFQTSPSAYNFFTGGNPGDTGWVHYSVDITQYVAGGGTYMLRFGNEEYFYYYHMGVDNVSITSDPIRPTIPEPGTLLLLGTGLTILGRLRKR